MIHKHKLNNLEDLAKACCVLLASVCLIQILTIRQQEMNLLCWGANDIAIATSSNQDDELIELEEEQAIH